MDKDPGIDLEYRRGPMLERMNRVILYQQTKELLGRIDLRLRELEGFGGVSTEKQFSNPREESTHLHNLKTLSVLTRQRERVIQKLEELQDHIQLDIEMDKCYENTR